MWTKRFCGTLMLALGLLLAFHLGLHTTQAAMTVARDRFVLGTDGSDAGNDCSDEAHPCRTVQHAINQAVDGDTICVAKHTLVSTGLYKERLTITKSVTLDGAWTAMCVGIPPNPPCKFTPSSCDPTRLTLDAEGLGRVISITNANPTIHCFTITGGDAGGLPGDPNHGGGIAARNAAPIIVNNVITGNYGCTTMACTGYGRGGGIYLADSPATAVISGNLIANNVADDSTWGRGGGIYLENASPQVLFNTVHTNRAGLSAGDGGGIAVTDGSPVIADNVILTNTSGTGVMCNGGGVFVSSGTPVTIERNLIQGNVALRGTQDPAFSSRGGGLYFHGALAVIRDNEVYGNVAILSDERGLGGGMFLTGLSEEAVVSGNVIAHDNRASYDADGKGGGIYLDECYATVAENQVFGNIAASETPGYGGGIYIEGGGGVFQSNAITGNTSVLGAVGGWGWGGGLSISGSVALVQDNLIAQNIAISAPDGYGSGGGVNVWAGAPRFFGNVVVDNTANWGDMGFGGGFSLSGARPWLDGNTILRNQTAGADGGGGGGGVRLASCSAFTLTNNIIAHNRTGANGSGIALSNSGSNKGLIAHNTIVQNLGGDGAGVFASGRWGATLQNNIIISQAVGIVNAAPPTVTLTATHTLFEANGLNYGAGVDSENEIPGPAALLPDYHLSGGSNAIDRALPLPWVTRDIDGDPRPLGAAPDVGADERRPHIYLPLVLRNG